MKGRREKNEKGVERRMKKSEGQNVKNKQRKKEIKKYKQMLK